MAEERIEYQPWEIPDIADADDTAIIKHRLADLKRQSHNEGMQQGHEQGYQQGYQEGYSKGEREIAELKKTLIATIAIFDDPLQAMGSDLEMKLVSCLQELSKKLIMREISLDPKIIYQVVCQAKQLIVAEGASYKLHLPTTTYRTLLSVLNPDQLQQFEIIEDQALAEGDFFLHSDTSTIDGRLSERMATVLDKVLGKGKGKGKANDTSA